MKLRSGKVTLVEEKPVWRCTSDGHDVEDIIALRHERLDQPDLHPLLTCVMRDRRVLQPLPSLEASRAYHADQMAHLPDRYKTLHYGETYPVRLSAALEITQQQIEMAIREGAAPVQ